MATGRLDRPGAESRLAGMSLSVTLLGTGTSSGVPVLGCRCPVCTSEDPRNRRLRCGAVLELPGGTLLLDTPIDLRQQALAYGLRRVDAVLYTHGHADHLLGADELRIYNYRQGGAIPCFGSAATLAKLRHTFAYAFEEDGSGTSKPSFELREIRGPFDLLGARVIPVPVRHGEMEVLGFRLGAFAYVTDCNHIPEASFGLLEGLEVLVLGALRYRPHPTHFTLTEALAAAERIGARRTYFTHLAHEVDHGAPRVPLPPGLELASDGLAFELP